MLATTLLNPPQPVVAAPRAPLLEKIHAHERVANTIRERKGWRPVPYRWLPERYVHRRAGYLAYWARVHRRAVRLPDLTPGPRAAITRVFGAYAGQAISVANCESGLSIYATNGQYLGLFQMGEYARARYGHSWTALGQSRAAHAYFVASGRDWSPWTCRPG